MDLLHEIDMLREDNAKLVDLMVKDQEKIDGLKRLVKSLKESQTNTINELVSANKENARLRHALEELDYKLADEWPELESIVREALKMLDFSGEALQQDAMMPERRSVSYSDAIAEFLQTVREYGLIVDHIDTSGKVQRCATEDRPTKQNGWLRFCELDSGFSTHRLAIGESPKTATSGSLGLTSL